MKTNAKIFKRISPNNSGVVVSKTVLYTEAVLYSQVKWHIFLRLLIRIQHLKKGKRKSTRLKASNLSVLRGILFWYEKVTNRIKKGNCILLLQFEQNYKFTMLEGVLFWKL